MPLVTFPSSVYDKSNLKKAVKNMKHTEEKKESKVGKGLKAVLILSAIACVIAVMFVFAPGGDHVGEAKTPDVSEMLQGKQYEDVVTIFEEAGFRNVEAQGMEDLFLGILEKEGTVEEVSVGGDTQYKKGKWVHSNTKVVIRYHSYPENVVEHVTDQIGDAINSSPEAQDAIITMQNSLEFAGIMAADVLNSEEFQDFAEKFRSREISFDGTVDRVEDLGLDTYNIYLSAGEGKVGDIFLLNHVTADSLGVEDPETLMDQKVHIKAIVTSFDPEEGAITLDPVELIVQ